MSFKFLPIFLSLIFTLLSSFNITYCQKSQSFPPGITIDPSIEKLCKSQKDLNSFTVTHSINDTANTNPFLGALGKLPLLSLAISKTDTAFMFIGQLVPYGFRINFKNGECSVDIFVSSRSCKCFKSDLSDSSAEYGAHAKAVSLTLVLSKINNFQRDENIYGYIKANSGNIYHFPSPQSNSERWKFNYEGYFVVKFTPVD